MTTKKTDDASTAAPRKPRAKKTTVSVTTPARAAGGKLAQLVEMLKGSEGATVEAMSAATGWQAHSVRGAMSGALKKKAGHNIVSAKTEAGRIYRIARAEAE
jgi:hypothetical protein